MSVLDDEAPPVRISRKESKLIALIAEAVGDALAERLQAQEPEPEVVAPAHESRVPYHTLINGPPGTGLTGSVYTVGADPIQPLSVMCRLTTSAVVADRTVAVEFQDGTGTRFVLAGTQAVVQANGRQSFCWYPQAGEVAWPVEDAAISPLPEQYLSWGQKLALVVANGDAGDVIDNVRISARVTP